MWTLEELKVNFTIRLVLLKLSLGSWNPSAFFFVDWILDWRSRLGIFFNVCVFFLQAKLKSKWFADLFTDSVSDVGYASGFSFARSYSSLEWQSKQNSWNVPFIRNASRICATLSTVWLVIFPGFAAASVSQLSLFIWGAPGDPSAEGIPLLPLSSILFLFTP